MHPYGHFSEDGTEFIITDPKTPRAFDNFLWNDSAFSCVQQTGVGYFDYQVGNTEAVKLLTGIGRICDFDVHGRDGLMSRLVYIRDNDTGEFWNLGWEPVRVACDSFSCKHSPGYTIISSSSRGIESSFRLFIPEGKDPVELWTLTFGNSSEKKRDLTVFVYNQFSFKYKWGFDAYGDMLYRSATFSEKLNALIACKHPHHTPHNFQTGFMTSERMIDGYDGTRDSFVGIYNTLADPIAVVNGSCGNVPGSSDATIGAVQYNLTLAPECEEKIELILGATDSEEGIFAFRQQYLGHFDEAFELLTASRKALFSTNSLTCPDQHFSNLFNIWIKNQTLYGATWCRWGWMGYRDIVQHGFGVSSFRPERTRQILLDALAHQYASGLAVRGWNPVDEKAYSDSALWLVFTLTAYLKDSGDLAFLDEDVEYFDKGKDTVLAHIEQALDFLEANKGEHGALLIKFGDWNDSLTAIGKEGRGESIWLSMAYAEALRQMEELFTHLGQEKKAADYAARYMSIRDALNDSAWDGDWFVRCFDDQGRPIGSKENSQGKIFLNVQSWAMIAGIADNQRTDALIEACDRMLASDLGYLLLAPTFLERDNHIGRISYLEPGICENGTVYSHGNVFMILGLLKAGKVDKAYEVFRRITPGYMTGDNDLKQKCPPYVYANGYYGPDHRNNAGQMEFTWITGSVAWFYNLILREMVGVKSGYAGITIEPRLPSKWNEISIDYHLRDMTFKVSITRTGNPALALNGEELPGTTIPYESCSDVNTVEVTM